MNDKLAKVVEKYRDLPEFFTLEITGPNQKGNFDNTLLHVAAEKGALEDMQALIDTGADVNITGDQGFTPLHSAAMKGRLEAAKLLLKHGADPRKHNAWGKTALQIAETGKHRDVAELLRSHRK